MFVWKEKYVLGIGEIDKQHKALVDLINRLFSAMQSGAGKDVLEETLNGLVDYTRHHFMTEEILMGNYDFPDVDAHKMEHRKFAEEVEAFRQDFQSGNTGISIQLISFLRDWLDSHICETDYKYGEYLRGQGAR
ncbi:MAG: hemerythrin [Desulfuromonas sp.]|nr:MAG: hemerythrin [Desulfuromonas sp.]